MDIPLTGGLTKEAFDLLNPGWGMMLWAMEVSNLRPSACKAVGLVWLWHAQSDSDALQGGDDGL